MAPNNTWWFKKCCVAKEKLRRIGKHRNPYMLGLFYFCLANCMC